MFERPCVYVPDSDYVVHICGHRHIDIPLNEKNERGEPCGRCQRCGTRFVYRSPQDLAAMRRREVMAEHIQRVFPF